MAIVPGDEAEPGKVTGSMTTMTETAATTTSETWWQEIKMNPPRLERWLHQQFYGESMAKFRIEQFVEAHPEMSNAYRVALLGIAAQEIKHAVWVRKLLTDRNLRPRLEHPDGKDKGDRYWRETLPGAVTVETGAAVGAHAEAMRLERIRVIAADDACPDHLQDIQRVFKDILPEEEYHEWVFRTMAGADALEKTKGNHDLGRALLGLEP